MSLAGIQGDVWTGPPIKTFGVTTLGIDSIFNTAACCGRVYSHLRRNSSRCFPMCQRFNRCRVEIMRGAELELTSSDSDGTAAVRRGIWNDTASDKNGNCHFAELG